MGVCGYLISPYHICCFFQCFTTGDLVDEDNLPAAPLLDTLDSSASMIGGGMEDGAHGPESDVERDLFGDEPAPDETQPGDSPLGSAMALVPFSSGAPAASSSQVNGMQTLPIKAL